MEVISDMLQRMRELAVQAGNGTYTTNDRKELQKEVDQLKAEINRISASTEYNTKKLLTGDSAALWSTNDSSVIEAIVRGAPAEGNYRLDIEATGGANYVYKSDIMEYKAAQKTVEEYAYKFAYTGELSEGSYENRYGEIVNPFRVEVTTYTADATAEDVTNRVENMDTYRGKLANGEDSTFWVGLVGNATADATLASGYFVIEALEDGDFSKTMPKENAFKVTYYNGETGERTEIALSNSAMTSLVITISAGETDILTTGASIDFYFGATSTFAKGDTTLFSWTRAVEAASALLTYKIGDSGPTITNDALPPPDGAYYRYAVAEMDDSGKVSVGTGNFKLNEVTSTNKGISLLTVTPELTTRTLYTLSLDDIQGTTVDRAKARLVGGKYPDGLTVTIARGDTDIDTAGDPTLRVPSVDRFIKDDNLRGAIAAAGATSATGNSGYYLIEVIKDKQYVSTAPDTADLSSLSQADIEKLVANEDDFRVTFYDAETGLSQEVAVDTYVSAGPIGVLTFSGGFTINLSNQYGVDPSISKGDKILLKYQQNLTAGSTAEANVTVDDLTIRVDGDELDDFSFYNVQLDAVTGEVLFSRADLTLSDSTPGSFHFSTPDSKVAELSTRLKDIALFTNADGKNILDNTQELTIFGNGKTTTVYVEGNDTVEDFQNKLNAALLELGLGTGDENIDSQLVKYVTEEDAQRGGNYAVAGTFVFQSGIIGENGKINIIGDQDLLNALSVLNLQKGENSDLNVTVRDAHTNKVVGSDTISDNVLRGVIDGIDVKISNPSLITTFNSTTGKMTFTAPPESVSYNLHVVDNRTEVQIGANEGQTFDVSIGQIDTTSLEIDDAFVITMDESQRAITKFSQALEKVSSARATIGAQINRMEYTIKNLSISRENLISAESRIRDLDVAEESATFARNQILVNSAVAMLAQANTLPQIALQLLQ
jgi:flagellin-like hook-associated protein FlgL